MAVAVKSGQMIPGPQALPLLGWRGNLLRLFRYPFPYLSELHAKYGNIVSLERGKPAYVCAFGPEMNFRLLANPDLFELSAGPMAKLPKDTALGHLFLYSVPFMKGERHKQHRRLMLPSLHKKRIEIYHNDIAILTQQMLDSWHLGATIDVYPMMKELTLRIVIKALFGIEDENETKHISTLLQKVAATSPLTLSLPINVPGSPYARSLHVAEQMESLTLSLIAQKRLQPDATDILATLVNAHDEDGAALSDNELVSNVFTLFLAGHGTTSNALVWTLFLLDQHPAIFSDLLDELEGALHGDIPKPDQLMRLTLLDGVIKESLRLLSPLGMGIRVATEDCELGGFALPKGTGMIYSEYITHRLPELYQDPLRFKPERWATIKPSPYEYLPFSAGQHRCIGAEFAVYVLKMVLTMLLQRYRLSLVPNTKVGTTVEMHPSPGMPMKIVSPENRPCERVTVHGGIHQLIDLS